MPNILTNYTALDGTKKGRTVLTGFFDGASGQEASVLKINTWGMRGALSNASNGLQLLASALNGSYNRGSYNLTITGIQYSISAPGVVRLEFQGTGPDNTIAVLSGTGDLGPVRGSDYIFYPANNILGTGNVLLSTFAMPANGTYTISIEYKKDPTKFDQGQIARPKDFNIILPTGNNV